jgi:LytS/YehU family sensor histidine kinase
LVLWIITLVYNLFSENDVVMTGMISTIIVTIFITFFITSIYEGVNFYKNWTYNKLKSEKLEKENLSARYQTLKNQVNPHFLFNSLNTLMSYVEDNPNASEFVQNLSDFFRYVLNSRDKEVVSISEMKLKLSINISFCNNQGLERILK